MFIELGRSLQYIEAPVELFDAAKFFGNDCWLWSL